MSIETEINILPISVVWQLSSKCLLSIFCCNKVILSNPKQNIFKAIFFFSKAKWNLKETILAYLQYKFLIYVFFGNAGLKFLAFQKSYEKLIYKLQSEKKNSLVYDFIIVYYF